MTLRNVRVVQANAPKPAVPPRSDDGSSPRHVRRHSFNLSVSPADMRRASLDFLAANAVVVDVTSRESRPASPNPDNVSAIVVGLHFFLFLGSA